MAWLAEQLLTVIGRAAPQECITEARLAELTGLSPRQVENAVRKLRRHELVERVGAGCHRLTDAGREAAAAGCRVRAGPRGPETGHRRRDAGLRQLVWNALRQRKKLTIDDLAMLCAQGGERDLRSNIGKYLRALARAGYVQRMPIREAAYNLTSNGCIRWLLVTDTGRAAPVWRQGRAVLWDPNIEAEIAAVREIAPVPKRRRAA